MTFVIPAWLDSILQISWLFLLIILFIYLFAKVLAMFKIKNQFVIGAVAFLALTGTQLILENYYRVFYLNESDIVIKGNGETIENTVNKRLFTTDKEVFVYIGGGIPYQDTLPYSFNTKDGKTHDIQILIYFHEADIETIPSR